jgi:endonuclease/exonuclease/phosphatase (EEP) superfamily protein YafD
MNSGKQRNSLFARLLQLSFYLFVGVTLSPLLELIWTPLGLFGHFLPHLFVFSILFLAYFSIFGRRYEKMASLLVMLLLGTRLFMTALSGPEVKMTEKAVYSLYSHNVLFSNPDFSPLSDYLLENKPDFILLYEFNPRAMESLKEVWQQYPHRRMLPRYGYFGLALASKYPLENAEAIWPAHCDVPVLTAIAHTPDGPLRLLGIHPPSPPIPRDIKYQEEMMKGIISHFQDKDDPLLIAGDFNDTPFSFSYQENLKSSGLSRSGKAFGYHGTFPARWKGLGVELDHIWVNDKIRLQSYKMGPALGSDHFPIEMTFQIAQ